MISSIEFSQVWRDLEMMRKGIKSGDENIICEKYQSLDYADFASWPQGFDKVAENLKQTFNNKNTITGNFIIYHY
jgi:hypothetical protein